MSNLRKYLTDSGVKQADFAQRVDASQATVSKLVSGSAKPSLDLAARIERATGGAVPATSWVPEPTSMPADLTADGSASAAPGENSQSKDAA